jgi:hypothetical protein
MDYPTPTTQYLTPLAQYLHTTCPEGVPKGGPNRGPNRGFGGPPEGSKPSESQHTRARKYSYRYIVLQTPTYLPQIWGWEGLQVPSWGLGGLQEVS